jgi:CheY-like chemotaxis protein
MGGTFTLWNRPGGGAEAALVFPAELCEAAAPTPDVRPERPDLAGMRILLAEDNPTNQLVASQMLRALNAQVTLSSDGVEALERFEADEFDMIVVDIEMPRMTGLDVIRTIRARPDRRAQVPIVALTAYALREHRDRIAAAGANGLISKPITSVEALGEALRAHAPDILRREVMSDAAAPAPAAEEPVADLAVFDALCAAIGTGMMAELLEKVVVDLMQARADLANALSPLDRKPIRAASHILISVAGAIGATRLQHCARDLNLAAHGEDGRSLPGDVRRCLDEIDAAVAFAKSKRAAV